jgi:CBS domain-containing protein
MASGLKLFRRSAKASSSRPAVSLIGGLGLGAVLAYYFDPRLGRQRRARARDRAVHNARAGGRGAVALERDCTNRARGLLARLRALLEPQEVSDDVIHARVRAALGRACSHASALEVIVQGGQLTLRGPILEREHARLVRQARRVRGVRAVEDLLERHLHPTSIPGLQGSVPRTSKPQLRCADIMKHQAFTIGEDDTVERAAEKMALANVGFLPVCAADGRVLGAITDRDVAVRVVATGLSPVTCRVGDAMTRTLVACRPDDDLVVAEQLMARNQVSRLVITDENGNLRGVVSLSDVAEREPARRAAATLRAVAAREAPRS